MKKLSFMSLRSALAMAGACTASMAVSAAHAQNINNPLTGVAGSALNTTGAVVKEVGALHHNGPAQVVSSAAPALAPFADGVTNGVKTAGHGVSETGKVLAADGLTVRPGLALDAATGANGAANGGAVGGLVNGVGGVVGAATGTSTSGGASSGKPLVGLGIGSAAPAASVATVGVLPR